MRQRRCIGRLVLTALNLHKSLFVIQLMDIHDAVPLAGGALAVAAFSNCRLATGDSQPGRCEIITNADATVENDRFMRIEKFFPWRDVFAAAKQNVFPVLISTRFCPSSCRRPPLVQIWS